MTASPSSGDDGRNVLLDTSWRPDAQELTPRLARWVAEHFRAPCRLVDAAFPEEGGSSLNLMFSVEHEAGEVHRYVARMSSPVPRMRTLPDEDVGREARFMRVVRQNTSLPVPEVLFHEADAAWLGGPFLVMPRVEGRPWPSDPPYNFGGWVLESPPDVQADMQRRLVAVLGELHTVDTDRCDLSGLQRPTLGADVLECQLNYIRELYEWGRAGVRYPLVETALEQLAASRPRRSDAPCVNWGDARAGNLLFDGSRVTAVLDWEGAALGYPEVDVAFVCMMHRYYQQRAESRGIPGLPQLFRPADMTAEYAAVSGRELQDLWWYETLGATRAAAIQVRVVTRARAGREWETEDVDQVLSIKPVLHELLSRH